MKCYTGIRECASVTGIPSELLMLARAKIKSLPSAEMSLYMGTRGFHDSGRIYFTPELEKWITDNRTELEAVQDNEGRDYWLTRRDRASALLNELELEEKYKHTVDKQSVIDLLERISSAQVSLFNSKLRQELPARCNLNPQQIQEVDKVITDLFGVMEKGLSLWK